MRLLVDCWGGGGGCEKVCPKRERSGDYTYQGIVVRKNDQYQEECRMGAVKSREGCLMFKYCWQLNDSWESYSVQYRRRHPNKGRHVGDMSIVMGCHMGVMPDKAWCVAKKGSRMAVPVQEWMSDGCSCPIVDVRWQSCLRWVVRWLSCPTWDVRWQSCLRWGVRWLSWPRSDFRWHSCLRWGRVSDDRPVQDRMSDDSPV